MIRWRSWSGITGRSSWGSETADATAYLDSSSEKITLGKVARRRRGAIPGEGKEPKFALVGDK